MGAFQAGSLLALLEAGLRVDVLHGSSVGALNAVFLAARPDLERGRELARLWGEPTMVELLTLVGYFAMVCWLMNVARTPGPVT